MSESTVFDLQPTAGRVLHAAAIRDRLAHAYLFHGTEGTGKWEAAITTAKYIMCPGALDGAHANCSVCRRIEEYIHPDIHWLVPLASRENQRAESGSADDVGQFSKAQDEEYQQILSAKRKDRWAPLDYTRRPYITMSRVRALQSVLSRTPAEGPRKVGIIISAESMRQDAQSVLLKTIEEPPPNSYLILTAADKSALLPTILSRCQPVRFLPLSRELIARRLVDEIGLEEEHARSVADFSGGGWTRAVRLAGEEWGIWRQAAELLFKKAISASTDDLILAIDTVWAQRPGQDKILFCLEVWQSMLHRTALQLTVSQSNESLADNCLLSSMFAGRNLLSEARGAIVGNVTPKTAVASALLHLRSALFPYRAAIIPALEK